MSKRTSGSKCAVTRGEVDLAGFVNEDVPFGDLVQRLETRRSAARHPLFQVFFVLQTAGDAKLALEGLVARPLRVAQAASKFDLLLDLVETWDETRSPAGIVGTLEFSLDLYDRSTARRIGEIGRAHV